VLHNGEQEIERALASPADAVRVALMMLAHRGGLKSVTCSRCWRQTERRLAGAALKGRPRSPLFQDERKAHATLVRRPQGAERQLMEGFCCKTIFGAGTKNSFLAHGSNREF